MKSILNYFAILIFIFGIIGNIIVFIIYYSAAIKKYSISNYFRAVAIFDNLTLLNLFTLYLTNQFGIDLTKSIDFFCKFQTYFLYTNGPISTWLMVAISIDRYFNIAYPKRFLLLVNNNFQLVVIFTIIVFNYIYYSFLTWTSFLFNSSANGTNITMCIANVDYLITAWMDFFNSTILPFLLMIFISLALILSIQKSRAKIHNSASNNAGLSRRDRKFAMTTLSLNLIFLILLGPVEFYGIFNNTNDPANSAYNNMIDYIALELYYLNYAIGFYVQLVVNSLFRNEFLRFLKVKTNI
jgi:hypothetical protein